MKYLFTAISAVLLISACETQINQENSGFITLLGNDTLAVEQFEFTDNGITAMVILRSPETSFSSYDLRLDDSGGIQQMIRTDYSNENGFDGVGNIVHRIERMGDSLRIEIQTDDGSETYNTSYEPGILPFIDMVHWPFEVAFLNASSVEADTVNQPMLTRSNVSNFVIADIKEDSMTVRHPFRGVMGVNVSDNGGIEFLDAGRTTRKLNVYRTPNFNIHEIGAGFAAADQQGNPFGSLSGAVSSEFSFSGSDFRVDYGSPQKRGRELFGGIVPWGELWRTGANRATHFYTSSNLQFGDLVVPAGEYTLFTIPEQDGGTLIINKETGQNGNSYDKTQDLGRVPMNNISQDTTTEAFTITVEETEGGGQMKLIWGETVFSVNFDIQP